ncbi:hypothetical protein PV10_07166 [Exophiala mesophila]|uniref:Uncharacterized protein n=1 Tax=Exophiala mesophila TaxID=212818 RepID=A0A0D1XNW1_EXOME|nr:uncharacterized protein PV10_07166 [Exophiala mesophila]KIV89791.1 hypothetical protein PV10_07166 [Exophiala mesophila]
MLGQTLRRLHASTSVTFHLWRISSLLVLLWAIVLIWGERVVFDRSVTACQWQRWEKWPSYAQPHHVLLVADPQLVDPHTYPDRPWPLSTLTIFYTDKYLDRSYRRLQQKLLPDSTLFLGDLFDGGREWGDAKYSSPEERYRQYGKQFWLREYMRFSNIFLRPWPYGQATSQSEPAGRRLIASIPGNHDLGFAQGISLAVKKRFDAYFGPLNRLDIIGNHSFISIDSVSLSAMDQVEYTTGSSGLGDGTSPDTKAQKIWKPVEDFLTTAGDVKARAIRQTCENNLGWRDPKPRELFFPELKAYPRARKNTQNKDTEQVDERDAGMDMRQNSIRNHGQDLTRRAESDAQSAPPNKISSSGIPTVVLTHVPLFRAAGTHCGPHRERDTAIPLQAGYQYQNVLTPLVSQDIITHLHQEVTMIYSGDDHDYCEIEHNEFTGRPREITVKSMSWAMGIRIPGVQLVSLWNPVNCDQMMGGQEMSVPRDTVQNHLCLLPDQLGIFIRYAQTLVFTLIIIITATIRYKPSSAAEYRHGGHPKSDALLPLTKDYPSRHPASNTSSTSSTSSVLSHHQSDTYLSTRKSNGNGSSYGNIPASSRSSSPSKPPYPYAAGTDRNLEGLTFNDDDDWGMPSATASDRKASASQRRGPKTRLGYFIKTLWQVSWPVVCLYLWLVWKG